MIGLGISFASRGYTDGFIFTSFAKSLVSPIVLCCIVWIFRKRIVRDTRYDIAIATSIYLISELFGSFQEPFSNLHIENIVAILISGSVALLLHNMLEVAEKYVVK